MLVGNAQGELTGQNHSRGLFGGPLHRTDRSASPPSSTTGSGPDRPLNVRNDEHEEEEPEDDEPCPVQ